jgi:outer membrane receptor for ferrienterochelin and colicin
MPLSDKISMTSSLAGNYLFRINSKRQTKYPSNDEFRTFGKSKYSSSVVPNKYYNRTALVAEVGIAYHVFEHSDINVSLGSFVTNLYDKEETRQSTLFPIWLDVGYGYSF